MVNYYKVLKVSPDATTSEIKSSYRMLARKIHPDLNGVDEESSRRFADISKAYKILCNPQERAYYDKRRLRAKFAKNTSLFDLDENLHSSRAKQIVYEQRYNEIIDRLIAEEREESMALQQIIFPIVALFISTGFVAVFKPMFWSNSSVTGKIVMLTLFIVGVLHLMKRLHFGLKKYTYSNDKIHDSLFTNVDEDNRKYSRYQGISFVLIGMILSLIIGMFISDLLGVMTSQLMPKLFSRSLQFEFLFYPPIVVLFVDLMHKFANRIEQ